LGLTLASLAASCQNLRRTPSLDYNFGEPRGAQVILLAHISDPHLAPLPRPRLTDLAGKRAIGYINWIRTRRMIHRRDVLDALVADMHARHPDHIAVTGDLVNIALPEEIANARDWLRSVGNPEDVTLVPGNHDAYVRSAVPQLTRAWADYMNGDKHPVGKAGFPFVRRRGPLTLIGVSTAVPTAPFLATGELGHSQLLALESILDDVETRNTFRVLMIHHPLRSSQNRKHARLTDSDQLLDLLRRRGVDLVLHGHDHRHALIEVDGPSSRIPVVGVPSSSIAAGGHRDAAAYNLFSIERSDSNSWHVEMTTRGFNGENEIVELRKQTLR
jgi:3',5'-cyclic AMP phosphodiesterase CpdA